MAEVMKLKDILSDLQNVDSSGMHKTAEQKKTKISASHAKEELITALNNATMQKEASASSAEPVTDKLVKVAQDLAVSENEALVKEAHVYGAAVADGFMARLGQYEQAAGNTKLAEDQDFAKFAEENPELVKQAVELGYHHGKLQIEELKKQAFLQGYADTSAQIEELSKTAAGREKLAAIASELQSQDEEQEKIASAVEEWISTPEGQEALPYVQAGYKDTIEKVAAMNQGYQDTIEKIAAINQGYQEAAQEINKLASETFERGYTDTIKLLQAM